jgi:hypothetical protein
MAEDAVPFRIEEVGPFGGPFSGLSITQVGNGEDDLQERGGLGY